MAKFLSFLFSLLASSLLGQSSTWEYFYPGGTISSIAARGNTVLLASAYDGGLLVRFDTLGTPTFFDPVNSNLPFEYPELVAIDGTDHWWVQHPSGIATFDGTSWTNYDSIQIGFPFSSTFFTTLKAAPDGRIMAATNFKGVAVLDQNSWTIWNSSNTGLPSNNIRDIAFGNDSTLYFATSAGLAILKDGNWTIYNAANTSLTNFNNIKSVAVTANGTIWVTEGNFSVAKWEAGVWTEYSAADLGISSSVFFSGKVMTDDRDRLWLTFSKSISVLAAGSWTHYLESDIGCTLPVGVTVNTKLAIDGAGHLWATVCSLTVFDGQTWRKQDYGNAPLPEGQIFGITQDTSGNIWFAGTGGITRKTGNNWEAFDPVDINDSISPLNVYTAHADLKGNVWFGIDPGWILRFDGATWTVFDTIQSVFPGFASYWSTASAPDGTVWFSIVPTSAYSSRLARYKDGNWSFFSPNDAPLAPNYDIVGIVVEQDNTAWFVAHDRLLKFDGANWETFDPMAAGLNYNIIRGLALAPDEALWISTDAGLIRFDGTTWTTLTTANSDIPFDNTWRLTFDKAGGMYVGTDPVNPGANVAVLRNGVWTELLPPGFEPGFYTRPWTLLADRDNRLWFGNWSSNTVFLYDPMLVKTTEAPLSEQALQVFPNPASESITIQLPNGSDQRCQVRLTDVYGRLLFHETEVAQASMITLDLPTDLPFCLYLIEVLNTQGEKYSGRFLRVQPR